MSYSNCQFTWLKQKETLVSLAESLLKGGEYFDCQLCAEGHHFNVHRVILSCNSPVFSNLLQEHNSDLPVITLEGISSTELGALIEFMYTGVTRISPNYLKNFFQIAKSLRLAGLNHYDDLHIAKIVNENSNTETELQSYETYGLNILQCLDESESEGKEITALSNNIFLDDLETVDMVNDQSVIYEKHEVEFIKEESDMVGALEIKSGNTELTQICEEITGDASDAEEVSGNSLVYQNFQNILLKNENKASEDNLTTLYSITNLDNLDTKEEEFLEVQEELKVTDEDENYVYVKINNEALDRLREGTTSKGKQNPGKKDLKYCKKKCLRSINPVEKNFVIKRPKIQNISTKDVKLEGEDKKIYICLKCGNKYSHRRTLLHHIHWICEQPATYSCSLCPYRGKRKFQLKSHMKHVHLLKIS